MSLRHRRTANFRREGHGWYRLSARDAAGAAMAAILLVAVRWLFSWIAIIPNQVLFDPGSAVLVPLMGVSWGLFGMLGAFASSLAGDAVCGVWDAASYFRAVGMLAWAGSAHALWHAPPKGSPSAVFQMFRYLGAVLPGVAVSASWMGLGVEWAGRYHFDYVFGLRWIYDLPFLLIFGLPAFGLLLQRWPAWCPEAAGTGDYPIGRAAALVLTSLSAPLAGLLADGRISFRPSQLGEHGGRMVALIALMCLLSHLVLVLAPVGRGGGHPLRGPGRFYYRLRGAGSHS